MIKKISITSSSYLFNYDNIWGKLTKTYKLSFNNYKFYDQILINKSDCEVVILNFKDLIDYPVFEISEKRKKLISKNIINIFNIIKKKIKSNTNPLMLFIDYDYGNTSIKSSQNFPIEEKIISLIKLEIKKLFIFSNFFYFNIDSFNKNKNNYDSRLYYIGRSRYSVDCLKDISQKILETIKRIQTPPKKLLILDCDNTLWGGVVGEEGPLGIDIGTDGIGTIYRDFQKSVLRLKNEGVILCICSKNNPDDITEVFKKNKNLLLKMSDFTSVKSNWKNKTENILEISKDLDLSLDSFVFFDDNPIEREQIKKNLKDITVIDPNKDISYWPEQLFECFEFIKFKLTKEDINKTKQYRSRATFNYERKKNNNEILFLKNINLKAKIVKLTKNNEQRCLQIINKTNQFNLTTKRYNLTQIKEFANNKKNKIFMIELADKYGNHGLVSLIMWRCEKNFIYIDNFAMSCRVLGRYLETWILGEVIKYAKKNKVNFLLGEHIQTKKNDLVKNLYKDLGFKKITNNNQFPKNLRKFFIKKSNKFIANVNHLKLSGYEKCYK